MSESQCGPHGLRGDGGLRLGFMVGCFHAPPFKEEERKIELSVSEVNVWRMFISGMWLL